MYNRINAGVDALAKQEGFAYTAGFLQSQLLQAISLLPKTKQKLVLEDFERAVGSKVMVKSKNVVTGLEFDIPWNEKGNPALDPGMESYWSM